MLQRKLIGTLIITLLLVMMAFAGVLVPFINTSILLLFIVAFFITVLVIEWVGNEHASGDKSRRKVEKVLREFDDDELSLLRSRLMQDEREEEYGSMADLIQTGKRKNEMR